MHQEIRQRVGGRLQPAVFLDRNDHGGLFAVGGDHLWSCAQGLFYYLIQAILLFLEHGYLLSFVNLADHPVVPNAITPQITRGAGRCLAGTARVFALVRSRVGS
ncbi:hypothetical protein THIOKS12260011 [Thiocapsa sp. KS1]|nr:hypothetical protein THIOKS12260011 [Thiocapsa sp. KS1]